MQGNIEVKEEGNKITVIIVKPAQGRPSASGKSEVLATTGGASILPSGDKLNLTVYRTR